MKQNFKDVKRFDPTIQANTPQSRRKSGGQKVSSKNINQVISDKEKEIQKRINQEINSLNRDVLRTHKRNSSPIFQQSKCTTMTDHEEIKITESLSATHRLTQDLMMQSIFKPVGLLESSEPNFHFILNKISMHQGDQESDFDDYKRSPKHTSKSLMMVYQECVHSQVSEEAGLGMPILNDENLEILLKESTEKSVSEDENSVIPFDQLNNIVNQYAQLQLKKSPSDEDEYK